MKNYFTNFRLKKWGYYLILFFCSVISFYSVFLFPKNKFVKLISILVRYNNARFLITFALFLFLSFSIKNIRLSNFSILIVVFPIFAFALNGLWASMYTETNVIAGVLPRRDALSFFTSSMDLIEGGALVGYTVRRPLFGGFFAFLFWIFGGNFQLALATIAYISACASYFTLLETRKTLNQFAAIIFFIPQFFYYRIYIGNVLSETLGFILGMIAITFFLMSFQRKKANLPNSMFLYLSGVFFFTLSQLSRPGAVITLPLMVIYAGWIFREKNKIRIKIIMYAILVILIAYSLNSFLFNQLVGPRINKFNNSLQGIYGVVIGGKGWYQIFLDFPELNTLPPGLREKRMVEIIFSELLTNPNNFIKGMGTQFSTIFSLTPIYSFNIYSYMLTNNLMVSTILIYFYYFLSTIGITYSVIKRNNPFYGFVLVLTLGFVLSLPVAPAFHSQYMRYYPATIPLLGLLPAIGITSLLHPILKKSIFSKHLLPIINDELFLINKYFSYLFALLLILAPLVFTSSSPKEYIQTNACQKDEYEVIINYYPSTAVSVIANGDTWLPNISIGNFKIGIHNIPANNSINEFERIPLPTTIFPTINLIDKKPFYVAIDSLKLPQHKTTFRACGFYDNLLGEGIFYPSKIEEIN